MALFFPQTSSVVILPSVPLLTGTEQWKNNSFLHTSFGQSTLPWSGPDQLEATKVDV